MPTLPSSPQRRTVGGNEPLALTQPFAMSRVEGDCAGRDSHALTWHVAPTAVPRDKFSTPSLAVPASTAFVKACASLCDATHLTSHSVAVPYAWMALLVAFAAVPSRTDS
eukprot:3461372-Pleurochrysis_carterae.AAC.1